MITTIEIDGIKLEIPQDCPLFSWSDEDDEWDFRCSDHYYGLSCNTHPRKYLPLPIIAAVACQWWFQKATKAPRGERRILFLYAKAWESFTLKPE